ncbi:MAG: GNAT family N-acetyltransferase [Candidatus Acidiferrales bacterium]
MLTIRAAVAADVPAITAIYNEAIATTTATFDTEPKSEADRVAWLAHHGARYPVWVADLDGAVVGWASLSPFAERAAYDDTCENSFYVLAAKQGLGIGRQLLAESLDAARRIGFHTVVSRIAGESAVSEHLHERFGFRIAGTLKEVGLKFGRRLDVHLMQLMLKAGGDT